MSAPRMWRCFQYGTIFSPKGVVCSTHVEMFLGLKITLLLLFRLLHACGDVSNYRYIHFKAQASAPRMWRCFFSLLYIYYSVLVCSTHVEMFPSIMPVTINCASLLHACGDVSFEGSSDAPAYPSAPRMWRCFHSSMMHLAFHSVCSTHVEMFPSSFFIVVR